MFSTGGLMKKIVQIHGNPIRIQVRWNCNIGFPPLTFVSQPIGEPPFAGVFHYHASTVHIQQHIAVVV